MEVARVGGRRRLAGALPVRGEHMYAKIGDLSDGIESLIHVLAPRRTKRVLSQCHGPLIMVKNSDT